MVKELLTAIEEQSGLEQEKKIFDMTLYQMKYMLKKYENENNDSIDGVKEFIEFVKENSDSKDVEEIYSLSDNLLFRLQGLLGQDLDEKVKLTEKHCKQLETYKKEADQLESYLSVDIDEKAIARIYKSVKKTENSISDLEVQIATLEDERRSVNGQYIATNAEFKKNVETYLEQVELNDDTDRLTKYSQVATNIIEEYKVRLQKRKVSIVAETMTTCYKKLANKKNLIDKIHMNEVTLDLTYINYDGNEVPKTSLSAGEKQLMVISLLWALAICSKRKLPVIIDTPLSRLDSNHRETLINKYFPNASDQTIILSTDSEINAEYYEMMKLNVGDEFTLYYDDQLKATSIRKGYFVEEVSC